MAEHIETLLKRREAIDEELRTRNGLEIDTFREVHGKCGRVTDQKVGDQNTGREATHQAYYFHPIMVTICEDHKTESRRWVNIDVTTL
jgi:hypothetical protein